MGQLSPTRRLKVCYVLSYYAARYVRTEALVEALRHLPFVELYEARNTRTGLVRYLETLWKLLKVRLKHNPDVYIIGFRGHEIYFPARLIIGPGKRVIFDEFVSPYDSLVHERKKLSPTARPARLLYSVERRILHSADLLLADTPAQAAQYSRTFQLPLAKFRPIPVGVDELAFALDGPRHDYGTDEFVVFTYATFLPLHGIDVILRAAALLREHPIRLVIAGGKGAPQAEFQETIRALGLTNVEHIPWIDFDLLPEYIRGADVCLGGPFGNTPQAQRVITGKTVQFMACGKATVVGESEETGILTSGQDCLIVPQGDARQLADAILWAFENPEALPALGDKARQAYLLHFSQERIREEMERILRSEKVNHLA